MFGMMKQWCKIVDTYPDFLAYWMHARSKNVNDQIILWRTSYMEKYAELLDKQVKNYEEENVDWKEVARKIFPLLRNRLKLMRQAKDNILVLCKAVFAKASERLALDFDIVFVIYVGVGCGAGWATTYKGKAAVLLGLENIAEQKWHTKNKLKGLIAHEIGHLAHMSWRNEWEIFEKAEKDPLFQLYSEGFAQRCEHVILGRETWHMTQDKEWLPWCEEHKSWLAKEFLKRLEIQASVNDFFGSWFNIQGKIQTGYFLGHAFIRALEKTNSLRKIALFSIDEVRELGILYLKSIKDGIIR